MTVEYTMSSSRAYFSGTMDAAHSASMEGDMKFLKPVLKMASASSALASIRSSSLERESRTEKGGLESSCQCSDGKE